MKIRLTLTETTRIISFCLFISIIKSNDFNGNKIEPQRVYRVKDTANYYFVKPNDSILDQLRSESPRYNPDYSIAQFIGGNNKKQKDSKRRKANSKKKRMIKITDIDEFLKKYKNKNPSKDAGKSDPMAEEKVDPDHPEVMSRKPLKRNPEARDAGKKLSDPGCGITDDIGQRIVNGKDAPEGAHPWIVAILKDGDAWCGGSILNDRWVITAAHCFMDDQTASSYAIRVGTNNRNSGTTYKIEKVVSHQRFNLDNMLNSDVCMLKTNKPIEFTKKVKPICLPDNNYDDPKNPFLIVAGWGQQSFENPDLPVVLQDVKLKIVTDGQCVNKYKLKKYIIYRSQVCTWNKDQDACQGDSGGPAIEIVSGKAYLIGVVSYGSTCADEFPGVYTQISYFLNWIGETVKNH